MNLWRTAGPPMTPAPTLYYQGNTATAVRGSLPPHSTPVSSAGQAASRNDALEWPVTLSGIS